MSAPSPFELSRAIGTNLGALTKERREKASIDDILQRAATSQDPNALNQFMGEVVSSVSPEKQKGVLDILQNRADQFKKQQVQQGRSSFFEKQGLDPNLAFAPENVQLEAFKRTSEKEDEGKEFKKLREKSVAETTTKFIEAGNEAEDLEFTLDTAEQAIKGEVAEPGLMAALKNNPYSAIFIGLTPDEATLQASNKKLLEGTKGLFGPRPTEREIFLLLNQMLPSIGKTRESNLAGLSFIRRLNDIKILRGQVTSELTDGGSRFVPNLEQQVNEQLKPVITQYREDLNNAVSEQNQNKSKEKTKKTKISPSDLLINQARKSKGGS